ncbi:hypothetical protein GGR50DRAFT_404985 [Xylaria sp. CBS 124048]|nr:hypothetical protein GGR50DRAFT_404985 [Xylaria sp. CBS 124048]
MADLGRAAQTAIRSTCSLLRTAPIRSQLCRNPALNSSVFGPVPGGKGNHISTTASRLAFNGPKQPTQTSSMSPSRNRQTSFAPLPWSNPGRSTQRDADNIADIKKPRSSSYEAVHDADTIDSDDLNLADIQSTPKTVSDAVMPVSQEQIRMVPRTGRTVYVKSNVDVARSFKLLAVQVSQNRLRQDFYSQRFHERPGMKRKRLKSERWQKRFKKGFKATIARVRELTAQGW